MVADDVFMSAIQLISGPVPVLYWVNPGFLSKICEVYSYSTGAATKYHESYYYDRAQLLLDKRDARRYADQPSVTPISHSAPERAILCVSGWEISEPLSF